MSQWGRSDLVAGHGLGMVPDLPEQVAQTPPCRRIPGVQPQRFAVAILGCHAPYSPLSAPEVSQVIMHIDLNDCKH